MTSLTNNPHPPSKNFFFNCKLASRVALLMQLADSGWGAAGATMLQTATLALVHSTAEYCAPVCCHSVHTRLIDLPSMTPCEL